MSSEEKSIKFKAWFEDASKGETWFNFFESLLPAPSASLAGEAEDAAGPRFLAGAKSPTHADYLLFDLMDTAEGLHPTAATKLLGSYQALSAWRLTMGSRPNIAAYFASPQRRAA